MESFERQECLIQLRLNGGGISGSPRTVALDKDAQCRQTHLSSHGGLLCYVRQAGINRQSSGASG